MAINPLGNALGLGSLGNLGNQLQNAYKQTEYDHLNKLNQQQISAKQQVFYDRIKGAVALDPDLGRKLQVALAQEAPVKYKPKTNVQWLDEQVNKVRVKL